MDTTNREASGNLPPASELVARPGTQLLLLHSLTPANLGPSFGSAAVDRPVAVDVWQGLPYLPASAIKGVMAGRQKEAQARGDQTAQARLHLLYGQADEKDRGNGKPGKLVFGDGEPLAFPLLLADGERVLVIVLSTLYRLAALDLVPHPGLPPLHDPWTVGGEVELHRLPRLQPPLSWRELPATRQAVAALLGPEASWVGVPEDFEATGNGAASEAFASPWVLAAGEAARCLWQLAVEQRTLTALESNRTVRQGSLRTVELIPAGTVFVFLLGNRVQRSAGLGPASPLQLGAWESTGQGYFRMRWGAQGEAEVSSRPPLAPTPRPRPRDELASADYQVMVKVHTRLVGFRDNEAQGDPGLAARLRSAIDDLGPRLAQRGLALTLAFCLAKAGGPAEEGEAMLPPATGAEPEEPGQQDSEAQGAGAREPDSPRQAKPEPESPERVRGRERRAYVWLLRCLFPPPEAARQQDDAVELHARVVAAIQDPQCLPPDFYPTRLWLRRHAETLLAKE